MTNKKSTKRALLASVLSLVLCFAMLIGSTFAWFTDSATTGVNTIQAGTLDVALHAATAWDDTGAPSAWANVEGETLNFRTADNRSEIFWEPGATYELPALKIVNEGNLAFKFKLLVNGVYGDMALANVLDVKVNGAFLTKADGTNVTLADMMADPDGAAYGIILPVNATPNTEAPAAEQAITTVGETVPYVIALQMRADAGNEYQGNTLNGMAFTVYAAQYAFENDSYSNQYDKDAQYLIIDNEVALREALEAGKSVVLSDNLDVTETIDVKNDAVVNLNGKKLGVSSDVSDALVVSNGATMTLVNGTVDFASGGENNAILVTNTTAGTTSTLDLQNVSINFANDNKDQAGYNAIYANAEEGDVVVNIGEGAVVNAKSYHYAPVVVGKNATVNMTGGTIDVENTDPGQTGCVWGVYLDDNTSVFNMTGGVINVKGSHSASGIYGAYVACTVNMSGGTINITTDSAYGIGMEVYSPSKDSGLNSYINLTGGTINVMATGGVQGIAVDAGSRCTVTATKDAVVNVYTSIWENNVVGNDVVAANATVNEITNP